MLLSFLTFRLYDEFMTEKIVLDFEEELLRDETELNEDISDYVSSLFGINDCLINDSSLNPQVRLQELEKVKKEIIKQFEDGQFQDEYKSLLGSEALSLERKYLFNILSDLLAVTKEEEITKEKFLESILNEFSYLDSNDFYKNPESDIRLVNFEDFPVSESDINLKRKQIIKNSFEGNLEKYLNLFREKCLNVTSTLYKQALFIESQNLTNDQIKNLIQYLAAISEHAKYSKNKPYEKTEVLLENKFIARLMTNGKKEFMEALKIIKLKDSLTEDDKDLVSLFLWLKKSPEENVKVIEALLDISERKKIFPEEKPTNELCLKVKENVFEIKHTVIDEEQKLIKGLIAEEKRIKRKALEKRIARVFAAFLLIITLKLGYNFFTDIERIYKTNFIKTARISMESIPYPGEIKDSLNPGINETRQRQRLDFIRDLNLRYFKILSIFLSPEQNLTDSEISLLAIPDAIKDKAAIKTVRAQLVHIISKKEWKENFEDLFGKNVLTQLRAYGAVSNFLLPVLGHYVLRDSHGMPVVRNGQIQIYSAPSEKEFLNGLEPKVYIEKYDQNYKNILKSCKTLLQRIQKRKSDLFREYKKNKKSKELNLTFKAISILESRLVDLISKIQQRHDYILEHNTYRAPLSKS